MHVKCLAQCPAPRGRSRNVCRDHVDEFELPHSSRTRSCAAGRIYGLITQAPGSSYFRNEGHSTRGDGVPALGRLRPWRGRQTRSNKLVNKITHRGITLCRNPAGRQDRERHGLKVRKPPTRPATDKWVKKAWYRHTQEDDSAFKRKEVLPFATVWMGLDDIMLNERRQTPKDLREEYKYQTHRSRK